MEFFDRRILMSYYLSMNEKSIKVYVTQHIQRPKVLSVWHRLKNLREYTAKMPSC